MEQSRKYVAKLEPIGQGSIQPVDEKERILNSPYFISVANTAEAMIMAGGLPAEEYDELIEDAIAFTDKLIEKVGERL